MTAERCGVEGKFIFPSRDAAKVFARELQNRNGGRGKAYRCSFGDHYHATRSYMGRSGRKGGK